MRVYNVPNEYRERVDVVRLTDIAAHFKECGRGYGASLVSPVSYFLRRAVFVYAAAFRVLFSDNLFR